VKKKILGNISTFFETLKPYSQETAQNFEKRVLQKCLRIAFYTYITMNLHHFLKKHHNHCTLVGNKKKMQVCLPKHNYKLDNNL
jgi:hypothetical protein